MNEVEQLEIEIDALAQTLASTVARAEAAEQLSDRYGKFVQECGFLADIEVYSPDDIPVIAERLEAFRARAEAAEQRAEALAAELAQARAEGEAAGRAAERADVVAMLRNAADEVGGVWMADAADGIEAGEHVGAAGGAA